MDPDRLAEPDTEANAVKPIPKVVTTGSPLSEVDVEGKLPAFTVTV
jgi:hypothetical protein